MFQALKGMIFEEAGAPSKTATPQPARESGFGRFFVKRMREGSTTADHIISYLRELEAVTGLNAALKPFNQEGAMIAGIGYSRGEEKV